MENDDALPRPRLRVLFGHAIPLGPGKAELLEHIAATGSISAAARLMNMSYRRAWLLVDTINQCFRMPLVETATGGKGGGGAHVTEYGLALLQRYRDMERKANEACADDLAAIFAELVDTPPDNPH